MKYNPSSYSSLSILLRSACSVVSNGRICRESIMLDKSKWLSLLGVNLIVVISLSDILSVHEKMLESDNIHNV